MFSHAVSENVLLLLNLVAATLNQWRSQPRNFWGAKMFDFRRITLFCLEKRLAKHKMTIFSKNLGGYGPFGPPGYAYALYFQFLHSVHVS